MGNDMRGKASGSGGVGQVETQLLEEGVLAAVTCQQPAAGGKRIERAVEAKATDEFTDKRSTGTMRSVFSLPRGT
jgi:hypothetical protein